jgi:hypothetical protein
VTDPGREAHRLPFALESHPPWASACQCIEGVIVERSAAQGEEYQEAFEFHGGTLPLPWRIVVIR